ncbi:MAG: FG-GAP-like repeat-containing protein [Myxococcales bacterium]
MVTSPLATGRQADGMVRLYFSIGDELHCLQANGRGCDGFPVALGEKAVVLGLPAVGDFDGDSVEEVAVSLNDGRVAVVKADGSPLLGFSFRAPKGLQAGPSFLQLDGDRRPALLVGDKEGRLHALRPDGSEHAGFPLKKGGAVTSAASAGLLGEPAQAALVWGNEDGRVYASDARGKPLNGFPVVTGYMVSGQPAIGDLDGDGLNDVAIASQDFKVYAARHDGSLLPGYPVAVGARMLTGPALGDLDGDGRLELVVAASDGQVHAFDIRGQQLKGFPVKLGDRLVGAGLVADLDRDGAEEVLAVSADGKLHVLKANGRPFPGFPARLEGLPDSGPVVFELDGQVHIAQAAGEKVSVFKVRRAGSSDRPLAWPEPGHDSARGGRRCPNPPSFADLQIQPKAPVTDDELRASYRFFDLDGDPEPRAQVRWFRDGKEVPELAGRLTVPASMTTKKQRWRFELSAPGAVTRQSPEVVIANSKPGAPKIAFDPDPPRRVSGVKVRIVEEAPDADGDKIRYTYAWLKDGRPQKGFDKPELAALSIKKSERWTVVVTGSDGEAAGPSASLEAVVADSAPTAPEVALSPASPRRGDPIKVVIKRAASDVDSDPLKYRYRFFIDGVPQPFASTVDTLPPLTARKGQSVSVEIQADDGELLGPITTAQVTLLNTRPTVPSPAIAPAAPRFGDTLTAGLAAPSKDIDGDALSYRFAFLKNGKRLEPPDAARDIKKGETYQLEAVASDGEADSEVGRVSVTVKNTSPTPPVLAFEKLPLRRVDPVKVRIAEPSQDVDGDKVTYTYAWSKNGELQPGLTGPELPAGTVRKGERWVVTVTPSDGEEAGRPARIEALVADSPPTAPEVALSPESPKTGDAIKAVIRREASDADGDKLRYRYRFLVDGTPVALDASVDSLPTLSVGKKRTVVVEVRADDGEQLGPIAKASAVVQNTAPTAPEALLLPKEAYCTDALKAGLAKPASDVDGDRLAYSFAFFKNGKKVEARADGREIGGLRKGETYEVVVAASDGETVSPAARASVTIKNSKPTAPVIAFEKLPLRRVEPVKVKIVEPSTDADGDPITYAYSWSRNGQPQPEHTRPELPAGTVRKGERWTVTVTPSDGTEQGASARLDAVVADSAPTAPEVALTPANPKTGDEIRAVIRREASDVDGDKLRYRYRFLVDGTALNFEDSIDKLPPFTVAKKRAVTVEVQADDGELLGPVARASATLVNTPPEPPAALLLPPRPVRGESLEAALAEEAKDADGDRLSYRFAFFKGGKKVEASADGRQVSDIRKGETYELVIIANDGEADSAPARALVKVENTPPTAPAVSFSDQAPKSGQAVEVRVDRPSADADGDPIAYEYAFTVDGKPADLPPGARSIPAGKLKKHQKWVVEVTPRDGEQAGRPGRAQLEVVNTAPTAPKVAIEPARPTAGSGATVKISAPAADHDGDAVTYRHAWYVDGVRLDLPTTATSIKPSVLKRGERVKVVVTPFDGEVEGEAAEASATVQNSAPLAPQVAVEPASPTVKDELVCAVKKAASDPDRETPALRFTWKRDGKPVPVGLEQSRVPAGVARHGETWRCEVVATDGELSSAAASAEARVLNSAPSAPEVVVEPEEPRAGDELLCRLAAPAADADEDTLAYEFRWLQGKKVLATDPKAPWKLPATGVGKQHSYRCEVTPRDSEAKGAVASAEGRYRNSPPTQPSVRLMPDQPAPDDTLVCKIIAEAADPDGDQVRYRYHWWKNGVQQSFAQSTTQVPARLVKAGDIWKCGVVPSDSETEGPAATSGDVIVGTRPPTAGR